MKESQSEWLGPEGIQFDLILVEIVFELFELLLLGFRKGDLAFKDEPLLGSEYVSSCVGEGVLAGMSRKASSGIRG